jgi:CBS domain-containing protein
MKQILDAAKNIKKNILVKDIMTKNVIGLEKHETVYEAVKTMGERSISTIVSSHEGRLIGIFTERDVINRIILKQRDPKKTKIEEVMTKEPKTISPDEPILKASSLMDRYKVRKLVVVNEKKEAIGIISQTDIIKSMQKIDHNYRTLLWNPMLSLVILGVIVVLFILNQIFFR